MDRIARTSTNAFVNYFNTKRRTGTVSLSERYKLLLLWFFNDIKNDGQSLYEYGLVDDYTNGWKLDTEFEGKVDAVFDKSVKCLVDGTCNIKYMDGDCTSLDETLWYTDSTADEFFDVLVSNDTDMIEDGIERNDLSFSEAIEAYIWEQDSFIFVSESTTSDGRPVYLECEKESL